MFAGVLQLSLGLLDLLGIALIGLVAAVAVSGVGLTQIAAPKRTFGHSPIFTCNRVPDFCHFGAFCHNNPNCENWPFCAHGSKDCILSGKPTGLTLRQT